MNPPPAYPPSQPPPQAQPQPPQWTPPQPPPPSGRSTWVWLGPLLGVLAVFCVVAMVSGLRYCARASDASGVRASNAVPASALARLEKQHVLLPGESIVAYYDGTLGGDGTEVAMVTTERLVSINGARVTALALADVVDVRHHTEPITGDVIEAQGDGGQTIKIEVAPLNGGDFFFSSLEAAWKKKRPGAVTTPPPSATR
jgi:hypothetical protein